MIAATGYRQQRHTRKAPGQTTLAAATDSYDNEAPGI